MEDGASAYQATQSDLKAPIVRGGISLLWAALAGLSLAIATGAITVRLLAGPRFDGFLIFAAAAAAAVLVFRLLVRESAPPEPIPAAVPEPLRDLFESAGPAMVAIDLDCRLTYVNPSAERLLGYHAEELKTEWGKFEILGPGEGV